ncbi:hypothetical protein BDU57DRAFT_521710 [Ampelomyces quisqualis]|uniref:Uncharacterized protein n=1 Tax=Ampelomyces quisqualis TaxID=50730 RepID=A0A6A5QCD6_AMPQU|nr:hypothetical protein BDU57DRAFT_521710 [Ampelomyces quisqualis]
MASARATRDGVKAATCNLHYCASRGAWSARRIKFRLHMRLWSATLAVTRATEEKFCELMSGVRSDLQDGGGPGGGGVASANGVTVMHAGLIRLCLVGGATLGCIGGEGFDDA